MISFTVPCSMLRPSFHISYTQRLFLHQMVCMTMLFVMRETERKFRCLATEQALVRWRFTGAFSAVFLRVAVGPSRHISATSCVRFLSCLRFVSCLVTFVYCGAGATADPPAGAAPAPAGDGLLSCAFGAGAGDAAFFLTNLIFCHSS